MTHSSCVIDTVAALDHVHMNRVICLFQVSGIAALSLQFLLFYGEGPAAVKLIHNRAPPE